MKKPADLRAHLARHVPSLARNPDKLHLIIDKGRLATKPGRSLSFEWRYTLQIIITDFPESPDVLAVPLLSWLEVNQPDLLIDPERASHAVDFEAEIIDHNTVDIGLTLELSERVVVHQVPGGYECEHVGEPQLDALDGPRGWQVYLKGELIVTSNP